MASHPGGGQGASIDEVTRLGALRRLARAPAGANQTVVVNWSRFGGASRSWRRIMQSTGASSFHDPQAQPTAACRRGGGRFILPSVGSLGTCRMKVAGSQDTSRVAKQQAWNEGRKAFQIYRHGGKNQNPYPDGSELHDSWNSGFEKEASSGTPGGEGT